MEITSQETLIPSGVSIGRYVVRNWIARGGMGDVYAAYDSNLNRKVAIKLVRVEDGTGIDGVDPKTRLLREAQALATLSHPNVVIIHDVGSYEDRVFIAMEFIEGATVSAWLHAQPRTWRAILKVFIAAGRGLQHAHEANLVHRDFKPENVMVRVDGEVRVMDFGLVRHVGAQETIAAPTSVPLGPRPMGDDGATAPLVNASAVTETGALMGTPAYMAPEQFDGQPTDARSDQFGFCVALYEALYGVRPFSGPTMPALASNVRAGHIKSPPERSPVPINIWQALRRGLSVKPAERYPSMNELLADLQRYPEPLGRKVRATETLLTAADLASLLETLLQRPVQAKQQGDGSAHAGGVLAVYAGDGGAATALVHFDLLAAGSTAAALTALSPVIVQEASRAGRLPQALLDNLLEVANVLTALIRSMSTARVRIQGIYPLPGSLPPGILGALETPSFLSSFEVAVSDYPGGRITVMGLEPPTVATSRQLPQRLTRALIVDDSGAMRLVVGRSLRRLGVAEVLEASNGEEGLACLRGRADIEAVFVDWSMPVMDGLTLIRAIRADGRFDGLSLLMVTTEGDPAQMDAALTAGADEYLVKPISDELLRSKLDGIGLRTI